MMTDADPCALCGEKPLVVADHPSSWLVYCRGCYDLSGTIGIGATPFGAAADWNIENHRARTLSR